MRSVHRDVDWLTRADIAILKLLAAPQRLELSAGNIAHNIQYSRAHVSTRCSELVQRGLLERVENGDPFYAVTDLGQAVAEGSADPVDLQ